MFGCLGVYVLRFLYAFQPWLAMVGNGWQWLDNPLGLLTGLEDGEDVKIAALGCPPDRRVWPATVLTAWFIGEPYA